MKAGDVVKCKADIATKRVGGAVFLRLDSVNEDTWFWEDGFVPARLN